MTTGLRATNLQIINRVLTKLKYNEVTALSATKQSRMMLGLLNEVLSELTDAGDWQETYAEALVTATSSVGEYEVAVSGLVQRIEEVQFGSQIAPLLVTNKESIRRLQRAGGVGTPRQFAVVGVNASSGNPNIRVHPVPGSAQSGSVFTIAHHTRPIAQTTADSASVMPYPSEVIFKGLYAKALLEENGGEQSGEYRAAYAEFAREKRESMNRFNADTGNDIYLVPGNGLYS